MPHWEAPIRLPMKSCPNLPDGSNFTLPKQSKRRTPRSFWLIRTTRPWPGHPSPSTCPTIRSCVSRFLTTSRVERIRWSGARYRRRMGTGFPAISHSQSGPVRMCRTVHPANVHKFDRGAALGLGSGPLAGISGPGPDFRYLGQLALIIRPALSSVWQIGPDVTRRVKRFTLAAGLFYILISIFALFVQASGQSDKGWLSSITDTLTDTRWGRYWELRIVFAGLVILVSLIAAWWRPRRRILTAIALLILSAFLPLPHAMVSHASAQPYSGKRNNCHRLPAPGRAGPVGWWVGHVAHHHLGRGRSPARRPADHAGPRPAPFFLARDHVCARRWVDRFL